MSQAIKALVNLASNASLIDENSILTMIAETEINEEQKRALLKENSNQLAETIYDLPEIKCFPMIPAEDEEDEQENKETDDETQDKENASKVVNY
ncbi:hypothetical protein [Litorilituus sediminis]|uniref:Uncharacterized protein n=1 Tax=Litorilituus sediminis TaxID=718192 RepID=A0A4P6P8M8_9GAMM|nr:hypothetical protein [Litorilituus sediminis]QBG35837.1 hypothetical protein EMK97_08975 [Litorilituus sediminis]